jgi:hypothetical protein
VRALNNSGTQLAIVNKKLLGWYLYSMCGVAKIRGFFGSPVDAELSYLTLSLAEDNRCSLRVLCAVSDVIHENLIVLADVIERLHDQSSVCY